MEEEKTGELHVVEYDGNPSMASLRYINEHGGIECELGFSRDGAEMIVEAVQEWINYHDERMNKLFQDLGEMDCE